MNSITAPSQGQPGRIDSVADAVYRKVAWRLIPLLFLCYIAAYLDRVNVAFAKLQMLQALNLSEAVYGLGASIFFIGYFIFEIPSNMMLHRVGAGRWIARIMVSWAVLSAAMMFVNSALSFYIVRFLLGVAEAGFFPGIILYLTYWFPASPSRGWSATRCRAGSCIRSAGPSACRAGSGCSCWRPCPRWCWACWPGSISRIA
jgi:sugar phosphate permease